MKRESFSSELIFVDLMMAPYQSPLNRYRVSRIVVKNYNLIQIKTFYNFVEL